MPNLSQKQRFLNSLSEKTILKLIFQIIYYDDDNEEINVLSNYVFDCMVGLSFRYMVPFENGSVKKSRDIICNVLPYLDENRFREMVRVNWNTFDIIINLIKDDDVFHGPNSWKQFPVEVQTAIVLYRLGCYGEGSSKGKMAKLFGVGDGGTIGIITKRVFKAICNLKSNFLVWYVDGTEIKLAEKPTVDPEAYFSRKNNYSLKLQVVCDHQLIIRQAIIGYPGSVNDSRMYKECPLYTNTFEYFSGSEYVVGDSAYQLSSTLITPYKQSSRKVTYTILYERNSFNRRISKYRVKIENCIGMLKERFGSLKELKLLIGSDKNNKIACQWILTCLILHNIIKRNGADDDFYVEERDNTEDNQNEIENCDEMDNEVFNCEAEDKRRAILEILKILN